jgi:PEP-CTERM motif
VTIELCEQELSEEDMCGDSFGESRGELFVRLGSGHFDRALAAALGVGRLVIDGEVEMGIDGVTGQPSSLVRLAGSAGGSADVNLYASEVPEPSTWLMVGLGALLYRRQARR